MAAGALALAGCEAPPTPVEGGFTGIDMARGHAMRDDALKSQAPAVVKRTRVVIAGGGVAGLAAARALRRADAEVILIDRRNHHIFQPLLYQVATAVLSPAEIAAPIRQLEA